MTQRIKGGTIERSWLEWTQDMRDWHAVICNVPVDQNTFLPLFQPHLDWLEADGFEGEVFLDNTPDQTQGYRERTGRIRFLFRNEQAAMNFKIRFG